jgi:hypothetical protein
MEHQVQAELQVQMVVQVQMELVELMVQAVHQGLTVHQELAE